MNTFLSSLYASVTSYMYMVDNFLTLFDPNRAKFFFSSGCPNDNFLCPKNVAQKNYKYEGEMSTVGEQNSTVALGQ